MTMFEVVKVSVAVTTILIAVVFCAITVVVFMAKYAKWLYKKVFGEDF